MSSPNMQNTSLLPSPDSKSDDITSPSIISTAVNDEGWFSEGLVVVVIGASGDLAKKKTYPSLFKLYLKNLLPVGTIIWGYARSAKTSELFRSQIKPYLVKSSTSEKVLDDFLSKCYYIKGNSYGDLEAFSDLSQKIYGHEQLSPTRAAHNRLFYLAIPPNVFGDAGIAIKKKAMARHGWSRIIIEKPFGRDLSSCMELSKVLAAQFQEHHLYRIDHYLGKEMVQNLMIFRFGNSWLDWLWNRNAVASIVISFKENIGTEGRGGYFDQYGIIRDVIQNHLLQVLTLLTMEPPVKIEGAGAGSYIRDAKVQILKSIPPILLEDCLLGQYDGYLDDPTILNKESNCPTFVALRCYINNPRWYGVPIIFQAGKALDERKCEVRVQFKDAPASIPMIGTKCQRNELVLRLQPDVSMHMKTNIKSPGFSSLPVQSDMKLDYGSEFDMSDAGNNNPDAYTRLILDVLRGKHAGFVRDDELKRSWEIFTPLLHQIERECVKPMSYKFGTTGPKDLEKFLSEKGDYAVDDDFIKGGGIAKCSL